MNVFSPEFLGLFLIAVVILTLRARKKRAGTVLPGKQISIRGNQLVTYLSKETPLSCLLTDGRFFGDDYQDKDVPELPHREGCRCELREIVRRSREITENSSPDSSTQTSDMGQLNRSDARFYRFALIAYHPEATEPMKSEYLDLANNAKVSEKFQQRVESHLGDRSKITSPNLSTKVLK